MDGDVRGSYVYFRSSGCALILDCTGPRLPRVVHWGADLGELSTADLAALARTGEPQRVSNTVDELVPVSILPEHSVGWLGTAGLVGHRDGADFSTSFEVLSVDVQPADGTIAHQLTVIATDAAAYLGLVLELELTVSGLVRQRATW
jgi:alpha-galactosidase